MSGKLDQAFAFNSAALALRIQRHSAIASNIANADTPGYRARDIDFRTALHRATGDAAPGSGAPRPKVVATSAGHLAPQSAHAVTRTQLRPVAQAAADANTVDMDVERARFAENTLRYEAALKSINGQIRSLLSAIQG